MKNTWMTLASVLLLLSLAAPAAARGKGAPTTPGKYTEWNDEIDELEVLQAFKVADYDRVVVEPFDTSRAALPKSDDNTYEPVKNVLAKAAEPFVEGLKGEFSAKPVEMQEKAKTGARTLVIRAKVVEMDPGSKAARYWAGFGAGAARAQITGEVVDGATGKTLFRFTQERRSGVGMMGGDYEKLMNRNLRTIGEDLAGVLKAF
jgi:hypothetical protein